MSEKVDFMIIGAQKCATSTLFRILDKHPLLNGSSNKEPHFFSNTEDWESGLQDYHSLFNFQPGHLTFEGSTTYTFAPHRNPHIWDDTYSYNPEMKFIYMVRNPADRLVSAYMHAYERGYTDTDLVTAIQNEPYFMDVTRYQMQVRPYMDRFGKDRVLLIEFEDFNQHRGEVLESVAGFLGVDSDGFNDWDAEYDNPSIGGQKPNVAFDQARWWHRVVERISPKLWQRLTDNSSRAFDQKPVFPADTLKHILLELEPDIQFLEKELNKDLHQWREIKRPAEVS
ncbi:MAG: sulfotransferase family 2 domain-containing protein [Flavobacteriales bacterium]|nr:sulfotransferase family 2 domain-containing protein [Flavobacteriales bacterium]